MKDRIKEVRKFKEMNQSQFADYLGIPVSNIQSYETGRRSPSDAFVKLLCEKCRINDKWLLTGEGEMRKPLEREEEIAEIADMMLQEVEPSIKNALIKTISKASPEELALIAKLCEEFMSEYNKPPVD